MIERERSCMLGGEMLKKVKPSTVVGLVLIGGAILAASLQAVLVGAESPYVGILLLMDMLTFGAGLGVTATSLLGS